MPGRDTFDQSIQTGVNQLTDRQLALLDRDKARSVVARNARGREDLKELIDELGLWREMDVKAVGSFDRTVPTRPLLLTSDPSFVFRRRLSPASA